MKSVIGRLAVGNTPLIPLRFLPENLTLYAKCEFLNPSGSIKDRLARAVFDDAEQRGLLHSESIVLECSSGNTGIALAMQGAIRGYRVQIVLSEKASAERRQLIRQLGGEVIVVPAGSLQSGIALTEEMAAKDSRYFLPRQFENSLNARDHEETTAQEILRQREGCVDAFISGYGTGGTLVGIARGLRLHLPCVHICAMEPAEAPLLSQGTYAPHPIEGVALGFVPSLLQQIRIDRVLPVSGTEALAMSRRLAREFGLPVGPSSGANVVAALWTAKQMGRGRSVVTLLCDRSERYFSTPLFAA